MSLFINSNASQNAPSLANPKQRNEILQKGLSKLAKDSVSASQKTKAEESVTVQLSAAIKQNDVANSKISNGVSFLQAQHSTLETLEGAVNKIAELKNIASEGESSPGEKDGLNAQLSNIQARIEGLSEETFNDSNLFGGGSFKVHDNVEGSSFINVEKPNLSGIKSLLVAKNLSDEELSDNAITKAIKEVAGYRSSNKAQIEHLQYAAEKIVVSRSNIEALSSRISDTVSAQRSTDFARQNILVQTDGAISAQANTKTASALKLIE